MLLEVRQLGFEYAELSHGTRISQLPGIYEAVNAREIKISSVHNFCPLPLGIEAPSPNVFEFSDVRAYKRRAAIKNTISTIEFAAKVGAKFVVLHLGSLPICDFTSKLRRLLPRRSSRITAFASLALRAWRVRRAKAPLYMELVLESLKPILEKAREFDIKLGIEIRDKLEELPIELDFKQLLEKLGLDVVCYWHDVGHAQIKHNLGFINHRTWLQQMSVYMGGLHVHDVINQLSDHQAPGTGEVDFEMIAEFVKPQHIKVLELAPNVPAEQITAAYNLLKKIWGPE